MNDLIFMYIGLLSYLKINFLKIVSKIFVHAFVKFHDTVHKKSKCHLQVNHYHHTRKKSFIVIFVNK